MGIAKQMGHIYSYGIVKKYPDHEAGARLTEKKGTRIRKEERVTWYSSE